MNVEMENILGKVRELYMKYGIKSITMDEVAAELGMSKKTLYQHVADKEDLVGKYVDNEIELRQKQICECFRIGYNAIEELFEISLFMNKLMREQNPATEHDLRKYYPAQHQKIVKVRREGMYRYILLNLKKGKNEGLYRNDMDDEVIAKLYLSRSESMPLSSMYTVEEFTSIKNFVEFLTYHIRGIATQTGIEELEKNIKKFLSDKINK
jgi:TetR/AcrR family transcriptional regulator, cholesterol catabolism regulator